MRALRGLLLLLACACARGALPPGYEDELFCPEGACLRRVADLPPSWSGPRTRFYECASPGGSEVERPRAWGVALDPALKAQYAAEGWSAAAPCADSALEAPPWHRLLLAPPYMSGA